MSLYMSLCILFVYLSVTKKRLVESILNNWAGHEPSSGCTRTPGLLASAVYLIRTIVPVPVHSASASASAVYLIRTIGDARHDFQRSKLCTMGLDDQNL